jgi:glycosyltransferase involved in cell wall biosynthesis
MQKYVSCIIPFYNESDSFLLILDELLQIKEIDQIICVNDGSTNDLISKIQSQFNDIEIISLNKNKGKANAIRVGLLRAKNDDILLFDADLQKVEDTEIRLAIKKYFLNEYDLLIMENKGDNSIIDGLLKKTIFQSGKRLLFKNDLIQIFKKDVSRYELEVAINQYMIDRKKNIGWISSNSFNPHKVKKRGWVKGILEDITMTMQIVKYLGVRGYINQIRFFYKKSFM